MTQHYTVGMDIDGRSKTVTVEAEDALIAALKVKHEYPAAMITYSRKRNQRGDRRHPHLDLTAEAN